MNITLVAWRRLVRRKIGEVVFLALVGASSAHAQQATLSSEVKQLVELLAVGARSTVADIGAGSGEVTVEIARQLGPDSRVYGTDINDERLSEIARAARSAGLANVTVVKGDPNATNLPDACCDALIVRNVYHHFGDPPAMNASILRTLKPGGRFAVMDFRPRVPITAPISPAQRADGDTHGVLPETVADELKAAGFEIVQTIPSWPNRLFLVLAQKPN
jgi:ubiquinone/menaquinone biosynthesis C-methylase UbiE